jgi:hypothetical protein
VAAAADFPDFSMMFPKQANAVVLRALAGRPKTPQRDRQFYTFISGRPCSLGMPARVDGPATNNGEHQPLRKCAAGTVIYSNDRGVTFACSASALLP